MFLFLLLDFFARIFSKSFRDLPWDNFCGEFKCCFYIFFSRFYFTRVLQNGFISILQFWKFFWWVFYWFFSRKFQDKSYLIIFGFLVSALAGAVVSILQLYAENQSLKNYILWSFGANNQVTRNQLWVLFIVVLVGLFLSFKSIKPLIGNSLGNQYAKSLGVNLEQLKYFVSLFFLLSASVTAFLGPILFYRNCSSSF